MKRIRASDATHTLVSETVFDATVPAFRTVTKSSAVCHDSFEIFPSEVFPVSSRTFEHRKLSIRYVDYLVNAQLLVTDTTSKRFTHVFASGSWGITVGLERNV